MSSRPVLAPEVPAREADDSTTLAGLLGLQQQLRQESGGAPSVLAPLGPAELKAFYLLRREVEEAYLDQFRQLRGRLMRRREAEEAAGRPMRSLLVTSPSGGEGKTFISLNLALMLAVAPGARVLWVDVHARRPAFAQGEGTEYRRGIQDCLTGTPWREAARQVPHMDLYLMATGERGGRLRDAYDYHALREWLSRNASLFTWVVLDGPPMDEGPDAELLAHAADATLLTARPGVTPLERMEYLLGRLDRARLAGVLFNGTA